MVAMLNQMSELWSIGPLLCFFLRGGGGGREREKTFNLISHSWLLALGVQPTVLTRSLKWLFSSCRYCSHLHLTETMVCSIHIDLKGREETSETVGKDAKGILYQTTGSGQPVVKVLLAVVQTASREGFHQPGPHGEHVIPYDVVGGVFIILW